MQAPTVPSDLLTQILPEARLAVKIVIPSKNRFCRQLAAVNRMGNADAAEGVSRESKSGYARDEGFDSRYTVQMADVVLGHRVRPPGDHCPKGSACQPD